jgi:hypothetical protein
VQRIDISYGGEHYSTGDRSFEQLSAEIREALSEGIGWIEVNDGDGERRTAHLLITPGVPLALVPVPEGPAHDGTPDEDFPALLEE